MKSAGPIVGGNLGDLLPYGLVVADADGKIVQLNSQLEIMFGFTREQLLGRPVETLMCKERRARHVGSRATFADAPRARKMGDLSLMGCDRDGHEFPIHVGLRPLPDGATLAVVDDLRETSSEALTRMARSSQETLATTFGAIAHELNNPLACMLPSLEMALDVCRELDDGVPPTKESATELLSALEDCLEATQRIRGIVVDMATLEAARKPEDGAPLAAIARATARLIHARAPEDLHVDTEALGDPRVSCPSVHVGQILLNLCLNALHAMVESEMSGEIVLAVSTVGEFGVVDVRDQGPGVPAALRERIFAPFFTTRDAGSGIGLALCREKAKLLGGDVTLAESDARGSVFRLTLPLSTPAASSQR